MDLKATLLTKTSSKSGKVYKVIEIQLTNTYTKQVFLEKSEEEILRLSGLENNVPNNIEDEIPQEWR